MSVQVQGSTVSVILMIESLFHNTRVKFLKKDKSMDFEIQMYIKITTVSRFQDCLKLFPENILHGTVP
jgi:hypothetical protein